MSRARRIQFIRPLRSILVSIIIYAQHSQASSSIQDFKAKLCKHFLFPLMRYTPRPFIPSLFDHSNNEYKCIYYKCCKICPATAMLALMGRKCNSYSFLTSVLDGVSGQRQAPMALYSWYPQYKRLRGSQSWSGHRI
jgi:hypothetical protein